MAINKQVLLLLANYLWNLPDDYKRFNMVAYYREGYFNIHPNRVHESALGECGTSACAAGHMPFVEGIPKPTKDDLYWVDYIERVTGIDVIKSYKHDWIFGSYWSNTDNTPKGAAKRIYWFLKYGVPAEYSPCENEYIFVEHYRNMTSRFDIR